MSEWIDAIAANELKPGELRELDIDDLRVIIINLAGQYYAIENLCTHDGGDLGGGELDGDEIICPRHGAHFCIKTGTATVPPAYEDIETFPTRIVEGMVQVAV